MGKWPTKPKSQGLERHGTQGELYLRLSLLAYRVGDHPDRPPPSTRRQVDSRMFLEDAGHMDCDLSHPLWPHNPKSRPSEFGWFGVFRELSGLITRVIVQDWLSNTALLSYVFTSYPESALSALYLSPCAAGEPGHESDGRVMSDRRSANGDSGCKPGRNESTGTVWSKRRWWPRMGNECAVYTGIGECCALRPHSHHTAIITWTSHCSL